MRKLVGALDVRGATGELFNRLAVVLVLAVAWRWRRRSGLALIFLAWRWRRGSGLTLVLLACWRRRRSGLALVTFLVTWRRWRRSGLGVVFVHTAVTEVALASLSAVDRRGTAPAVRTAAKPIDETVAVEAGVATAGPVWRQLGLVIGQRSGLAIVLAWWTRRWRWGRLFAWRLGCGLSVGAQRDSDAFLLGKVGFGVQIPDAVIVDGAGPELRRAIVEKLLVAADVKAWRAYGGSC